MMLEIVQVTKKIEFAEMRFNNAETDKEIDAAITEMEIARLMRQELIQRKKGKEID